MQIGLFLTPSDESALAARCVSLGASFLPAAYPDWPLPVFTHPLPPVAEAYMRALVIWHPAIFRTDELIAIENRAYNPHGKVFLSSVWPVIRFDRSDGTERPAHQGRLYLDATEYSFRLACPPARLSASELADFQRRLTDLLHLYRVLGQWVRHQLVRVDRGLYSSLALSEEVKHTLSGPPA
jgi:hypothetical protein